MPLPQYGIGLAFSVGLVLTSIDMRRLFSILLIVMALPLLAAPSILNHDNSTLWAVVNTVLSYLRVQL